MKHEIEIPDLPEGWDAVAYRNHHDDDDLFINGNIMRGKYITKTCERLIVRKKQPRRIVLDETKEGSHDVAFHNADGIWTFWKIVEDNKCAE